MMTRDDCATFGFPDCDRQITITSDGLLRISEVCTILRIERHTVYKLIENHVLPSVRLTPRITLVSAAAVKDVIDRVR